MSKIYENTCYALLVVLFIGGFLFFFNLGKLPLTDPDETFYAETAKEMLIRNEWMTPHLYGQPQFEKPIMLYWLTHASYKLFGVNEFAARLPSAVFGVIGLVIIYFFGALLFNGRVAFFAALILAANAEYFIIARACITDMILTVFMLAGAYFFMRGYLLDRKFSYILSSASFALATLTKGPVALVLPLVSISLFYIFAKDLKAIRRIPFVSAAIVFIAITAPWYIAVYRLHGREFIDAFFGFHNVTRFISSEHKIGSQVYYNIPIILGGFFPWSAFLPLAFSRSVVGAFKAVENIKKAHIFLLSWFFVIFLFFSASSTKLPTYIFPLYISLAMIVAVLWDDFLTAAENGSGIKWMNVSFSFLVIAVFAGVVAAVLFIPSRYDSLKFGISVSGSFLAFGILLSGIAYRFKAFFASFMLIVYSVVMVILPVDAILIPRLADFETSKAVSGKLSALIKNGERLGSESNYLAGLAFYTGLFPVNLDKHYDLVNFLNSNERVWCVIKDKNHRQLYEPAVNSDPIKPSYLLYNLGKRAIVTNIIPDGCEYIVKRESPK